MPSMTATGNPCSISESTTIAEMFCIPTLGFSGKTETHFTPQMRSSSRVAGRQLMRDCVS